MDEQEEIYEAPMVTEVGDFAEVTLGTTRGNAFDGGLPPFVFQFV
ncbi:lasso RiPP family leader peptide-containing protein [Streptomyces sp. NPDC020845]